MIKIEKDFKEIPASLKSQTTTNHRNTIIQNSAYIYEAKYDSRYKHKDIKDALKKIYHRKCAFCEQRIEQFDVEHFRPKSIYYWLAFSWDNLLFACSTCNTHKLNHFETLQNKATYQTQDLDNIHELAEKYNTQENCQFIHPELEDAEPYLIFEKNGKISSNHRKVKYTLTTCKLDRRELNDERKRIWDDLVKKVNDRLLKRDFEKDEEKKKEILIAIRTLLENFKEDAQNPDNEFLAFRRFCVKNFLKYP